MPETKPLEPGTKPLEFEELLDRLREITDQLEKGQPGLERSLALYKEGVDVAAECRKMLERAEHIVRLHAADARPEAERESEAGA